MICKKVVLVEALTLKHVRINWHRQLECTHRNGLTWPSQHRRVTKWTSKAWCALTCRDHRSQSTRPAIKANQSVSMTRVLNTAVLAEGRHDLIPPCWCSHNNIITLPELNRNISHVDYGLDGVRWTGGVKWTWPVWFLHRTKEGNITCRILIEKV